MQDPQCRITFLDVNLKTIDLQCPYLQDWRLLPAPVNGSQNWNTLEPRKICGCGLGAK